MFLCVAVLRTSLELIAACFFSQHFKAFYKLNYVSLAAQEEEKTGLNIYFCSGKLTIILSVNTYRAGLALT